MNSRSPSPGCFLSVEGLTLDLFLGCLAEEKLHRQPVAVDFDLLFAKPPQGCSSDALEDTICYARCVDLIRETANRKHFQLIEHLSYEIHTALAQELPNNILIRVRVTKLHPPLPEMTKGVSFTYFSEGFSYE